MEQSQDDGTICAAVLERQQRRRAPGDRGRNGAQIDGLHRERRHGLTGVPGEVDEEPALVVRDAPADDGTGERNRPRFDVAGPAGILRESLPPAIP